MKRPVYITAASAISAQAPLSESWMHCPQVPEGPLAMAQDPDYTPFIKPIEARRMGKLLKRALATSASALQKAGIDRPDAILTGTGHGLVENSLAFLDDICRQSEELLKPTLFMQSTHNTIGSQTGIRTHCHGYNNTFAHGGSSFECALMNALDLMALQQIDSALVGAHDELTDTYYALLRSAGYASRQMTCPTGEASVAMVLQTDTPSHVQVQGMQMRFQPNEPALLQALDQLLDEAGLRRSNIGVLLTGCNGDPVNDTAYQPLAKALPDSEKAYYKHLFCESFSASAIGVYAAYCCLQQGVLPHALRLGGDGDLPTPPHWIVAHSFDNQDYSLILLSQC